MRSSRVRRRGWRQSTWTTRPPSRSTVSSSESDREHRGHAGSEVISPPAEVKPSIAHEGVDSRERMARTVSSLAGTSPTGRGHDFDFPQQHIRRVAQLTVVLHQHLRQLASLTRPTAQVRGQHGTIVQMRTKATSQISATARTLGQVRFELTPSIAAGAHDAVGYRVIPAIGVKKRALLEVERAGPVAVEMDHANPLSYDRVIRRDDPEAPGTRGLCLFDHELHS